jgi:hypothetical protein
MTMQPATPVIAALVLVTFASQLSAQSTKTRRESVVNDISGFSVVLVLGETQPGGAAGTQDLPAGARKALTDMREFLPYKHYRVLDAQWTSCCAPRPTTQVAGRLQGVVGTPGPNGAVNLVSRPYAFSVAASLSMTNIPVRFVLTPVDQGGRTDPHSAEKTRELEREREDLRAQIEALVSQIHRTKERVDVGLVPVDEIRPLQDRHAQLQRRLASLDADSETDGVRPIIDSSFTMDAGETVVVGTSRVGGDKALIAIVTAVRKSPTSR